MDSAHETPSNVVKLTPTLKNTKNTPLDVDRTIEGVEWSFRVFLDRDEFSCRVDVGCLPNWAGTLWTIDASFEGVVRLNQFSEAFTASQRFSATNWRRTFDFPLFNLMVLWGDASNSELLHVEIQVVVNDVDGLRMREALPMTSELLESPEADKILLFNDSKQLHVDSRLLCSHSKAFSQLFRDGDSSQVRIEADLEDFQALFSTDDPQKQITQENVEKVLNLASEFELVDALKRCGEFLTSSSASKMDKIRLLGWASDFRLFEAQEELLKRMTADELRNCDRSPAFEALSDAAKTGLIIAFSRVFEERKSKMESSEAANLTRTNRRKVFEDCAFKLKLAAELTSKLNSMLLEPPNSDDDDDDDVDSENDIEFYEPNRSNDDDSDVEDEYNDFE